MSFHFSDTLTVGDARTRLFAHYGLAADGGYEDAWVHMKMGPVPISIPNTASRKRAVKLHDLHHVATEYPTTWVGEAQISAWELAGGCGRFTAAWVLNFGGLLIGLLVAQRETFKAFVRGRRSRTLYDGEFDPSLLHLSVGQLRERLALDRDQRPATAGDYLAFTMMSVAALVVGGAQLAVLGGVLALPVYALARLSGVVG